MKALPESISTLLLTLTALSFGHLTSKHIHALRRRSLISSFDRFHIINVTFPCNLPSDRHGTVRIRLPQDIPDAPKEVTARRIISLQEEYMQNILQFKGGTILKEYLAPSAEQARTNFPNAMQIRFRRFTNAIRKEASLSASRNQVIKEPEIHTVLTSASQLVRKRRQSQKRDQRIDESCTEAGEPSEYDPNYLHLCKICSAKRLLPEDRYPRVLNEVFCKGTNTGCLGNGNGKCVPTIFNVHILKRRNDVCRLCVKDNEPLAINEWELYTEPVSVGCECMLDKNSDYKRHWFHKSKKNYSNIVISPIG